MKRHLKSNLFYKYLISHFIILLIPLVFMVFLIFNYFVDTLKDSIITNNQNMLIQVKDVVDLQLKEIQNISVRISSNSDLTPYMISKNAYKSMGGMRELNDYISTNGFISNLSLYIRNTDFIYSPFSTYTVPRFINETYNYNDWSYKDFKNTLDTCTTPIIRPAEEINFYNSIANYKELKNFVTYIVPVPPYNTPYGTVIYHIEEDSFKVLINNILKDYNGNTIIIDNTGKIITSLKDEEYMHSDDFNRLLQLTDFKGSKEVTLMENDYLFSYVNSEQSNWSYVTLIPIEEIMSKTSDIKNLTLLWVLVISSISSIVIYYMTKASYNPIKKLTDYTQEICGADIHITNELEVIRQAITQMSDNNKHLFNKLSDSKDALKDYLLFNLIKGKFYTKDEFNELGKEIDFSLSNDYYSILMFYIHNHSMPVEFSKANLIAYVESNLSQNYKGFIKDNIDNQLFILLLTTNEKSDKKVHQRIEALHQSIWDNWKINTTIGVGNQYNTPNEIGKSYLEASSALNYRLIHGNNKVITFSDIPNNNYQIDLPKDKIVLLEDAIRQGNNDIIERILEDILQFIQDENMPIFLVRCLCFDIINTIIKTLNSMDNNIILDKEKYPDVVSLMKFETVEELMRMVEKISHDICKYVTNNNALNDQLFDMIIDYTNNHYSDQNFSIQKLADDLNLSSSYLSRYYKQKAGKNISDYVNHLRIEKAKQLLKETNEPLQNLVETIGYHDVSSFIRKFRKITGVTPGTYRKMYR